METINDKKYLTPRIIFLTGNRRGKLFITRIDDQKTVF